MQTGVIPLLATIPRSYVQTPTSGLYAPRLRSTATLLAANGRHRYTTTTRSGGCPATSPATYSNITTDSVTITSSFSRLFANRSANTLFWSMPSMPTTICTIFSLIASQCISTTSIASKNCIYLLHKDIPSIRFWTFRYRSIINTIFWRPICSVLSIHRVIRCLLQSRAI